MGIMLYRKNICINIVFFLLFAFCLANCKENPKGSDFENSNIVVDLIHCPFIAMNIVHKDSIYKIGTEESDIPLFTTEKRRNKLYPIFRKDTIQMDDHSFDLLQQRCQFVIPQTRIDSICNRNKGNLLNVLFTKYENHYFLEESFSQAELAYLIYVLFQHQIYLMTDCETGELFVVNH